MSAGSARFGAPDRKCIAPRFSPLSRAGETKWEEKLAFPREPENNFHSMAGSSVPDCAPSSVAYTEASRVGAGSADFYQRLRSDMRTWLSSRVGRAHKLADVLCYAPDLLHLLCKLSADPRVSVQHKAKIAAVIAYFVAPVDAIPEALIGPGGYADDVALAAHALSGLLGTRRDILEEHWAGDRDLMEVVKSLLAVADGFMGLGIWSRLRARVGST